MKSSCIATVRNRRGTPVAGLGRESFQVFEDQVLQPIKHFSHEDIPVTVGLVLDNSGSMRPKREEVIAAALAFAASSNPQDQMFLVNFDEHVRFGLPSGTLFTDQPDQLKAAMSSIMANGQTALYARTGRHRGAERYWRTNPDPGDLLSLLFCGSGAAEILSREAPGTRRHQPALGRRHHLRTVGAGVRVRGVWCWTRTRDA